MAAKRKGGLPRQLTEDLVDEFVETLILAPETDPCRRFLESRKLWNTDLLAKFEIGCFGSLLIFPQRDEAGHLMPRYRTFDPIAPKEKRWGWSLGDGPTLFAWPWWPAPEKARVWIFEGEWDVMTAWFRLGFAEADMHAFTFTGGASVPLPFGLVPTWARKRQINLCYDNDVYQGPDWAKHKAPSEKAMAGMRQRRTALLKTAHSFDRHGAEVVLRAVPVGPLELWGGDLRDWTDSGGRDVESMPQALLSEVVAGENEVIERPDIDSIVLDAGLIVRVRCAVQTVEEEAVVVPMVTEVDCDMGTMTACNTCRAPRICPEKIISWEDFPEILAQGLTSHDFDRYVTRNFLGQPSRCPLCKLKVLTYRVMCRWTAATSVDGAREVTILSETPPNLSGESIVEGRVHHGARGQIVVLAQKILHVGQQRPATHALSPLRALFPYDRPVPEQINEYMQKRAQQLSRATRIYGRPALHQAFDLLYHSALWFVVKGKKHRGWLDLAAVGDTGSGKSTVAHNLAEFFGAGTVHLCMENVSRAGLTMGAVKDSRGNFRTRPGLLPRNHGKLLILDEFHVMMHDGWQRGDASPLMHLQSARDIGYVEGVKVYGARRLSAAVRLATISNWCGGRQSSTKFPCEHFGELYNRPEILRRLDVAITVNGEPNLACPDVEELPQATAQLLVQRAWAMKPEDVLIEPTVYDLAHEVTEEWRDRYAQGLALYTYADKPNGLIRLAIAASNLCFTHPEGRPEQCLVTPEHLEWAKGWLEDLWGSIGYEEFSSAHRLKEKLARPFHVEHSLSAGMGLFDASDALHTLDRMFAPMTKAEIQTYLGKGFVDAEAWCTKMVRLGAMESCLAANAYHREWRLTAGAHHILRGLVSMATDAPEAYEERVERLSEWWTRAGQRSGSSEPNLPPIDEVALV